MCWNVTRVSLWLMCSVHFVQSTQRTCLQTRPFVHGINSLLKLGVCASSENIDAPTLTHVWQELEYRIDVCRVTVVHTSKISSLKKKKKISFPVAVNNSIMAGPLVFL